MFTYGRLEKKIKRKQNGEENTNVLPGSKAKIMFIRRERTSHKERENEG